MGARKEVSTCGAGIRGVGGNHAKAAGRAAGQDVQARQPSSSLLCSCDAGRIAAEGLSPPAHPPGCHAPFSYLA